MNACALIEDRWLRTASDPGPGNATMVDPQSRMAAYSAAR